MMGGRARKAGLFTGMRFFLAGFEEGPKDQSRVAGEIAANGGRVAHVYDSSCTHLIVWNLPLNDPSCCAARKDGKAVATGTWITDCAETNSLVDIHDVLYRPVKELLGIPGRESLCICLTGYQGLARRNIVRMVGMMGAKFSKPLIGSVVTHLVCYKFEGEKYELAKKMDMLLVNHFWLEDSLKTWTLLPESDYAQSGWEAENLKSKETVVEDSGTGDDDTVAPESDAFAKKSPSAKGSPTAPHPQLLDDRNLNPALDGGLMTGSKAYGKSESRGSLSPPASNGKLRKGDSGLDHMTVDDIRSLDQTSNFPEPPVEDLPADVVVGEERNMNGRCDDDIEDDESTHLYEEDENENEFSCGRTTEEEVQCNGDFRVAEMEVCEPVDAVDTTCQKMELMGFATDNTNGQTASGANDQKCEPAGENIDSPGVKRRFSSQFASDDERPLEKRSGSGNEIGKNLTDLDMEEYFASAVNQQPVAVQVSNVEQDNSAPAPVRLPVNQISEDIAEGDPNSSFSIESSAMEILSDEPDHEMCDVQAGQEPPTVHQEGVDTDARSPNEEIVKTGLAGFRKGKKQALKTNASANNASPALAKIAQSYKPRKEKGNKKQAPVVEDKENHIANEDDKIVRKTKVKKSTATKKALESRKTSSPELPKMCFAVGGSTDERTYLHSIIKILGGKISKNRHQWRDEATHVVLPGPLRRTEKFLAGAAAGRWILKPEYLEASRKVGKFLQEESYEWCGEGTNDKGSISLEAPRKWRTSVASSGVGAFHGLRVLFYGECISPPMDTMKRALKAGGGVVLATDPPYTRHIADGVHFAIISPGIPKEDEFVQEFLKNEVACVLSDYFVDLVCHPSSSLERHILYDTEKAAIQHWMDVAQFGLRRPARQVKEPEDEDADEDDAFVDDVHCSECGKLDDEAVMLLCGDGKGKGCGAGIHIYCCQPQLEKVPDEDWFCVKCQ